MVDLATETMETMIKTKTGKKAKKKKNAKKTNALTTLLLKRMLHSDFQMTKSFVISMGLSTLIGMKRPQPAGSNLESRAGVDLGTAHNEVPGPYPAPTMALGKPEVATGTNQHRRKRQGCGGVTADATGAGLGGPRQSQVRGRHLLKLLTMHVTMFRVTATKMETDKESPRSRCPPTPRLGNWQTGLTALFQASTMHQEEVMMRAPNGLTKLLNKTAHSWNSKKRLGNGGGWAEDFLKQCRS